jgi:hypothetical protein
MRLVSASMRCGGTNVASTTDAYSITSSARNFKTKNPCRLEIDNEFKLGRLLDREVSGLAALRIGVRAVVREGRLHSRAYMGQF